MVVISIWDFEFVAFDRTMSIRRFGCKSNSSVYWGDEDSWGIRMFAFLLLYVWFLWIIYPWSSCMFISFKSFFGFENIMSRFQKII